jgi:hypothetical protein
MKKFYLLLSFISFLTIGNAQIYVDIDAASGGNGTSWANAYTNLQDAIDAANANDQIWVAAGTYLPTKDHTGNSTPTNNRDKNFHLATDMKIYGGFAGTETQLSARDAATNITILSGDFIGDDGVTGSGSAFAITGNTENAYHVMITAYLTAAAVIDGFTIKGGNANGSGVLISYQSQTHRNNGGGGMSNRSSSPTITNTTFSYNTAHNGGGMCNTFSSPTITNTTFSYNTARIRGGGMYNSRYSPTIKNSIFLHNTADEGGGMYNNACFPTITNTAFSYNTAVNGGGMFNNSSSSIITNTIFSYNTAVYHGGGMYNSSSSPIITNTTFSYNTGRMSYGGGMYNGSSSSPTITNTIFSYNKADYGGGMYNESSSSPIITNTTFSYNTAVYYGGGMYNESSSSPIITNTTFSYNAATNGGGMINLSSSPTIKNSIFWNNLKNNQNSVPGADIENSSSSPTVSYCLTQENSLYSSGTGIINNQDPLFVDAANGDFSLQTGSPCIDMGDGAIGNSANTTTSDLAGNARFNGVIDMGAYEGLLH